jgi:hypothetical protein
LSLTKENRELTYKDVRPFAGKADQMQKAYLSMYCVTFPKYEVNKNFLGKWLCNGTRFDSHKDTTSTKLESNSIEFTVNDD